MELITVDLDKIRVNPWNPNRMTKPKYEALKKSLQKFPEVMEGSRIIVREMGKDQYQIINGEHRFKALKELGFKDASIQNLGKVDDDKAKLMTLTLANVGTEDYDQKIRIINDIQSAFDLKEIALTIGEEYNALSAIIDDLNTDLTDSGTMDQMFDKYSTVQENDTEDMILGELGIAMDTDDLTGITRGYEPGETVPPRLTVEVLNHNSVRSALKMGIDKGFKNHQDTIDEACKCFVRQEKKRLSDLEEKKKAKEKAKKEKAKE